MTKFTDLFSTPKLFTSRRVISYFVVALVLGCTNALGNTPDSLYVGDSIRVVLVPAVTVQSIIAKNRVNPVVFNEISQAELQELHAVRDVPSLLQRMPSMLFYSENGNNIGYTNLNMRGFDQRRIAVLINGIPQNDPEDHNVYWVNFPDLAQNLQSVHVQRGAGLVSYGAAAIGGSVNMTTSNFTNQQFVRLTTGVGWQEGLPAERNTLNPFDRTVSPAVSKYGIEVSSGLVGNYAVYARLSKINSEGYRDRSGADLTSWFVSAARLDQNLSTQLNVFGGPVSDGLAYGGLPKEYTVNKTLRTQNLSYFEYDSAFNVQYATPRKPTEIENFSQPHAELLNDWIISDDLEFKSSLFYYTGSGFFDYDASWASPESLGFPTGSNVTNPLVRANVDNVQGGWIPRVVWTNELGQLTAGVELRLHRSQHWGKVAYAEGLPTDFDQQQKFYEYNGERDIVSLFARQNFIIQPDLVMSAELQVVHHRYGLTNEKQYGVFTQYQTTNGGVVGNGGDIFNVTYLFANPRLGLLWNATQTQSILFNLSFTQREPRRNNLYSASEAWLGAQPQFRTDTTGGVTAFDFSEPLTKPEQLLDFELQYSFEVNNAKFSVTGYWMEFFNELVKSGRRDVFGVPRDGNAPKSRHIGLELQASYALPLPGPVGVQLWANATLSQNRILEAEFVTTDSSISLAGNAIAGFPDILANGGVRFDFKGLSLDLAGRYVGGFFTDGFGDHADASTEYLQAVRSVAWYPSNEVDAAFVLNGSLMYSIKPAGPLPAISIRLQVNNMTNSLYNTGGNGAEFFPAAERNWYLGVEFVL